MKKKVLFVIILIVIMVVGISIGVKIYTANERERIKEANIEAKENSNQMTYINGKSIKDLPKEIPIEYAVNEGYFVYDGSKDNSIVYNKDVLDRFIINTRVGATNRIADKIRIVVYNYDGYPTIYDLEYKIFEETYINEEQKEVHKSGYILITDETRNNIIPRDIFVNDDIPGQYYGIKIIEDEGVNAASISLCLYAEINYNDPNKEPYKDIEIARYLLDSEVVNKKIGETANIQGFVELKRKDFIYIFNGQHFGELGYEIEEYTSANIDNKNQTCIDYLTLEEHDINYIEEGDLLICTGNFTKKEISDFDTENNAIIVLKAKDYDIMKQKALLNANTDITAGWIYKEEGYMYLKYDIKDNTYPDKTYHFPFIQKVYITNDTEIIGDLEKGKNVKVQYDDSKDILELKKIIIIE